MMIEMMTLDVFVRLLAENPSLELSLIDEELRVWGAKKTLQDRWISLGETRDGFEIRVDTSILEEVRALIEEEEKNLLKPIKEILGFLIETRNHLKGTRLSWYPTGRRELVIVAQKEDRTPLEEVFLGYTVDGWAVRLLRAEGTSGPTLEDLSLSTEA